MGTPKTCLLFIIFQVVYVISAQEVVKRVPQGFVGMRGKKFTDSDSTEFEQFYKRKPQFFVGVKGKKSLLNALEQDINHYYKRAPMGFVGMRGKKGIYTRETYPENYNYWPQGSLIGQIDYSTAEEDLIDENKAVTMDPEMTVIADLLNYIHKLEYELDASSKTGRQEEEDDRYGSTSNEHWNVNPNEVAKRAANIHQFFGVRGKKSIQNKRPYDLTFRGKFIGVRGKKDVKNNDAQELKFLLDQNAPWPKRKTQMGFFGMRGKKSIDDPDTSADAETTN